MGGMVKYVYHKFFLKIIFTTTNSYGNQQVLVEHLLYVKIVLEKKIGNEQSRQEFLPLRSFCGQRQMAILMCTCVCCRR